MLLWQALALVLIAAFVVGSFQSAAATAVLLINWVACTWLQSVMADPWAGQSYPYIGFAVFDLIAAIFILLLPINKWQAILSSTYIWGLSAHAWYGVSSQDSWSNTVYYYATHYMAWSQLWISVLWTGGNLAGYIDSGSYPWSGLLSRLRVRSTSSSSDEAGQ